MQVIIDVSLWTQEQKNYLHAAAYALLYQQAGIDAADMTVKNGVINAPSVTQDVSGILTQSNLKDFIAAEFAKMEITRLEALPEIQARGLELATSQFRDIKLAQVDTLIDAISNLSDAKVFLKKAVRFIIARS